MMRLSFIPPPDEVVMRSSRSNPNAGALCDVLVICRRGHGVALQLARVVGGGNYETYTTGKGEKTPAVRLPDGRMVAFVAATSENMEARVSRAITYAAKFKPRIVICLRQGMAVSHILDRIAIRRGRFPDVTWHSAETVGMFTLCIGYDGFDRGEFARLIDTQPAEVVVVSEEEEDEPGVLEMMNNLPSIPAAVPRSQPPRPPSPPRSRNNNSNSDRMSQAEIDEAMRLFESQQLNNSVPPSQQQPQLRMDVDARGAIVFPVHEGVHRALAYHPSTNANANTFMRTAASQRNEARMRLQGIIESNRLHTQIRGAVETNGSAKAVMERTRDETENTMAMGMTAENNTCMICMTSHITTAVLPCRHHLFCNVCITKWLETSKTCPMCKQEVLTCVQLIGHLDAQEECRKREREPGYMETIASELEEEAAELRKKAREMRGAAGDQANSNAP